MDGWRSRRAEMNRAIQRNIGNAAKAQIVILSILLVPGLAQSTHNLRCERFVVVSIADRQLAVLENGSVIATFPVSVGAMESPSPAGTFRIVSRLANPTYYRPGTVIPSGKNNPLATRWVGLSQKGYGIHGTNAPKSVGHAASHGCIRLGNRGMERLFTMLRVGDEAQIHDQRDVWVAAIFGPGTDENTVASAQLSGPTGGQ